MLPAKSRLFYLYHDVNKHACILNMDRKISNCFFPRLDRPQEVILKHLGQKTSFFFFTAAMHSGYDDDDDGLQLRLKHRQYKKSVMCDSKLTFCLEV